MWRRILVGTSSENESNKIFNLNRYSLLSKAFSKTPQQLNELPPPEIFELYFWCSILIKFKLKK